MSVLGFHLDDRTARGGDRPKAVDDVSFEIAKNEILCLVGESGSGKSVIAQSIMRLLPKTLRVAGGEIRLQGRAAMIFQEPMTALNPVMRCGDQIDEAFHRTRLSPPERRARAITCCARSRCRTPSGFSRRIPTSSPAASASAS
jgi:peptide/nickel transport system ATP-binding protein